MGKDLYFVNSRNIFRKINENVTEEKACDLIQVFCEGYNYKIFYIRSWQEENKIWYDVGSHTEFFVLI